MCEFMGEFFKMTTNTHQPDQPIQGQIPANALPLETGEIYEQLQDDSSMEVVDTDSPTIPQNNGGNSTAQSPNIKKDLKSPQSGSPAPKDSTSPANKDPRQSKGWRKGPSALEFIETERKNLHINPWNTDLWSSVIKEAINLNDPVIVREIYNDFLSFYPTNVCYRTNAEGRERNC
jgi:hypothetical protein